MKHKTKHLVIRKGCFTIQNANVRKGDNSKPEDHWSCVTHLSAEDMLKLAIIEEEKFKYSPWAGADNPFKGQNFDVNRKALSLWSFVANL